MSIVIDLQKEAISLNSDILLLLRKAFLVARKLKLKDFEDWISNELNGYKAGVIVPEYRFIRGKMQAMNPYRGWIPVGFEDNKTENSFCNRYIHESIPSILSLLNTGETTFSIPMNADVTSILNHGGEFDTDYRLQISINRLCNIIEQVKNGILDWSLILEENQILGEELKFTDEEQAIAHNVPCITNYISNFYGSVENSQIQQGTENSKQLSE